MAYTAAACNPVAGGTAAACNTAAGGTATACNTATGGAATARGCLRPSNTSHATTPGIGVSASAGKKSNGDDCRRDQKPLATTKHGSPPELHFDRDSSDYRYVLTGDDAPQLLRHELPRAAPSLDRCDLHAARDEREDAEVRVDRERAADQERRSGLGREERGRVGPRHLDRLAALHRAGRGVVLVPGRDVEACIAGSDRKPRRTVIHRGDVDDLSGNITTGERLALRPDLRQRNLRGRRWACGRLRNKVRLAIVFLKDLRVTRHAPCKRQQRKNRQLHVKLAPVTTRSLVTATGERSALWTLPGGPADPRGDRIGETIGRVTGRTRAAHEADPLAPAFAQPVAEVRGVNVHAKQVVEGRDRPQLERLCRYVARPPIALDRLELRADGRHQVTLKAPWKDGTRALLFEPHDLLARLVAAIAPPRFHMFRYVGVLSSHSKLRAEVVPTPPQDPTRYKAPPASGDQELLELAKDEGEGQHRNGRKRWAWLLGHVFRVYVETCPKCGGPMRWAEIADNPEAIARIMSKHGLQVRTPPPPYTPSHPKGQLRLRFGS